MKRLRRNEVIHAHQSEFSPILFDTLFGLLIFLGIDSFLDLKDATHFVFYLTSTFVVMHWWLKYKAADDAYGHEVNNSTVDLLFGIGEIVLLQMAMIAAAQADYVTAIVFFTLPLLLEAAWALLWRFFGTWHRNSAKRIRYMEQELEYTLFLDLGAAVVFGTVVSLASSLNETDLVWGFAVAYAVYTVMSYRLEIIDVKVM